MSDMQALLALLKELDDQLVTCMRCGMCQAVCPLYAETGRETDVARGKIALLQGLGAQMIKDPQAVQDRLTSCLLCGSCAANCPSGVKALDIFLKARAVLTGYIGLSPVKKGIFKVLLQHPALFNTITDMASNFQEIFTKPVNDMIGSSCARFALPGLGDRHFVPLTGQPLHSSQKEINEPAGKSGLRIAYYPGCVVDKVFPRVGLAGLKVLRHHGVGIFMPRVQACCGIPAISSGDMDTFKALVTNNVKTFGPALESFDYLITPCATCASTFKKVWPVFGKDLPADVRETAMKMAEKTMDITAFLVDKLGLAAPEAAPSGVKVTCHDPCHLKKSLGVAAQPRVVAKLNPKYQLVEMTESDVCCGCGGSFNLQHYDVSKKIGQRKCANILASGAEVVAAGCPACMLQISDMLSQAGAKVAVKHPVELYAESLT